MLHARTATAFGFVVPTTSVFIATCLALVLLGNRTTWGQDPPAVDAQTLVACYRAAMTSWDRPFSLHMKTTTSGTYPGRIESGSRQQDFVFRRDGRLFERFGTITDTNPRDRTVSTQSFFTLFDGDVCYQVRKYPGREYNGDIIRDFNDSDLNAALADEWSGGYLFGRILMGRATTSVAQYMLDNGGLQVVAQEEIDGTLCRVVEGDGRYGTVRVWIAPQKGYQAMGITISRRSDKHHFLREGVRLEDEDVVELTQTYGPFDVEEIDGTFYPISGDCAQEWVMKNQQHFKRTTKAKCWMVDLKPDFRSLRAFTLAPIEGASMRDPKISDAFYTVVKGRITPNAVNAADIDVATATANTAKPATPVKASESVAPPAEVRTSSNHLWIILPIVIVVVGLSYAAWRRSQTGPHN
jgi:hypothetical protein